MKLRNEKVESPAETIDSIVGWVKTLAIAFVVAVASLFLVGLITVKGFNNQRNRDREQDVAQRIERTIESCLQYNRDRTVDRIAAHEQIFALAKLSGRDFDISPVTSEEQERLDAFDKQTSIQYAYRNCSEQCVTAYLSKTIPDCAPSQNEDGT